MSYSDEDYVRMNITNEEGTYHEYMRIVNTAWWDSSDSTWNDVSKAANELKEYVTEVKNMDLAGFSDLNKIDMDSVNWEDIIQTELDEIDTSKLD